jgi:hypothetical protein
MNSETLSGKESKLKVSSNVGLNGTHCRNVDDVCKKYYREDRLQLYVGRFFEISFTSNALVGCKGTTSQDRT